MNTLKGRAAPAIPGKSLFIIPPGLSPFGRAGKQSNTGLKSNASIPHLLPQPDCSPSHLQKAGKDHVHTMVSGKQEHSGAFQRDSLLHTVGMASCAPNSCVGLDLEVSQEYSAESIFTELSELKCRGWMALVQADHCPQEKRKTDRHHECTRSEESPSEDGGRKQAPASHAEMPGRDASQQ